MLTSACLELREHRERRACARVVTFSCAAACGARVPGRYRPAEQDLLLDQVIDVADLPGEQRIYCFILFSRVGQGGSILDQQQLLGYIDLPLHLLQAALTAQLKYA